MSAPLYDHLEEVAARVGAATQILLFLDYDGTLTPIVDDPRRATLDPATRELVAALSRGEGLRVAVISGRALADVRRRVGLPNVVYAGNHGLEIEGPGLRFVEVTAQAGQDELQGLCRRVSRRLAGIPGAYVEYKGLTATVHFRRTPGGEAGRVSKAVWEAVRGDNAPFVLAKGSKSIEIRPVSDWNKGAAARWIRSKLGADHALCIYLGDDRTDEDAFAALEGEITVRVGSPAGTLARYHVKGPEEAADFLRWLVGRTVSSSGTETG